MPERLRPESRSRAASHRQTGSRAWPPPPRESPAGGAPDEPRYERMPLGVPLGVLFVVAVAMASLFGRMFLIR